MARSDIVHRLPEGADRLPLGMLIGIVLACTSVGAALSHAVLRAAQPASLAGAGEPAVPAMEAPATPDSSVPVPEQPAAAVALEAPTASKAAPVPQPATAPVVPVVPVVPAPAAPPANTEASDNHARVQPREPSARRSFQPGAVAYLRCEGAERPNARFPCPRDRKLEADVWAALATLTECTAADPGRGHGEARLSWGRGQPLVVAWRKPETTAGLDLRAVAKCAGTRMAGLRSSLPVDDAIAAFRFELR